MNRPRWHGAIAVWLGLTVGLAIRASGAVYAFGCLVLPALLAKSLFRETRPLLVAAPLLAAATAFAGFVLAHGLDWPPAHTAVSLLCLGVAAAWVVRAQRAR
jgi:ABC-type Mn2+/Zn2+ transport system permease subunit